MTTIVSVPYEFIADLEGGPLEGGNIYLGTYNLNPLIEANRILAYSNAAFTQPVAQPVRTSAGVAVGMNGSPIQIYIASAEYSIVITDANGSLVWSNLTVSNLSSGNSVLDNYSVDSGAVNAYVVANATAVGAYVPGLRVAVKIATTNTAASTLNYMGLGARAIMTQANTALSGGELQAGGIYELEYDGVNFQLLSPALQPQQIRNAAEIAAGVTPSNFWIHRYKDVPVERYGVTIGLGGDPDLNTAAVQRAINVAAAVSNTGGVVLFPQGTIRCRANSLNTGVNAVNFQGSGKGQSFLQAIGAAADQPILTMGVAGSGTRVPDIFLRGFALASDNNLASGIKADYIINSTFDDLFYYQLKNGYVASTCYGNGFRNSNAYLVTQDCYRNGIDCNNLSFDKVRCVGGNGMTFNSESSAVSIKACDFEGILVGGAAITIGPATTRQAHGFVIEGCYFENINGYAIYAVGVDANSILGLVVQGNYITGGFSGYGNAGAINAVRLQNVNGFSFEANEFEDWQTAGFEIASPTLVLNGRVRNNTNGRNGIPNLSTNNFDKSVEVANNWTGPTSSYRPTVLEFALTYGVAIATDALAGRTQIVTATNGVAFTMSNPTNGYAGQQVTWRIKNTSGGALGAVTWAGTFHLGAAWVSPATGTNRSITFEYDGANWIELYRTTADVSN